MKCEICGIREAVIHIQQIIGKERMDLHLCESCALERGIAGNEEKSELSISNLLTGLIDLRHMKGLRNKVCPRCDSSLEEIKKHERVGCGECFIVYSNEIRSFLNKMVGKTQHKGKYPKRLLTYKTFLVDVIKLKEGLKEAVKREDYEKAAVLRDRIKRLEKFPGDQ